MGRTCRTLSSPIENSQLWERGPPKSSFLRALPNALPWRVGSASLAEDEEDEEDDGSFSFQKARSRIVRLCDATCDVFAAKPCTERGRTRVSSES